MSELAVLNCGAGDLKVTFDKGNVMEVEKAKRTIEDMLRRGYALFVEDEPGHFVKVKKFDPKQEAYIIGEGAIYAGDQSPMVGGEGVVADAATSGPKKRGRPPGKGNASKPWKGARAVSMHGKKAIGVAPTAGG